MLAFVSSHQALADEVVEQGLLEVVQSLEYEKWRDSDLGKDRLELESLKNDDEEFVIALCLAMKDMIKKIIDMKCATT